MFTQTSPGPPPGAGVVLATASDLAAPPAGVGEAFLNKPANGFAGGEGDAAGDAAVAGVVIAVFFRVVLAAGSTAG